MEGRQLSCQDNQIVFCGDISHWPVHEIVVKMLSGGGDFPMFRKKIGW